MLSEARSSQRRVLLVDDSRDFAEVMAMLLRGWGYEVAVAYSAEAALTEAAKAPIDVVFSDLRLPGLSGADLLPLLKELETCRNAVCVSLSAQVGEEAENVSRRAGFMTHLAKPPSFAALRSLLSLT